MMTTEILKSGATKNLNQHEILPAPNDLGALANRINKDTKALHNKIDRMMTLKLALAVRDPRIFRQGLQSFYHVFASIERSLYERFEEDNGWSSILKEIWKPEIARKEKCEQDLMFWYDDKREKFEKPIMAEQIKFVEHIAEVTAAKPYLLLAYLHVMYLALFAGGRIIRSSISRAVGLFPRKADMKHEDIIKMGTNFFTFDVADENLLRQIYKRDYELLTRNSLTEEQKQEIIEESKYIFEQNNKCIGEIEKHNMAIISKKWGYLIVTKGYNVVIASFIFIFFCYLRKIVTYLL